MPIIDGSKERPLTQAEQRKGVADGYVKSVGVPSVEDLTPRCWNAEQRQATADHFAEHAKPGDAPVSEAEQRRLNGLAQLESAK
jgi:hypothetical protein